MQHSYALNVWQNINVDARRLGRKERLKVNKHNAIRSKKIRESARGENCTLKIAGVCNYDPETTILAHLPDESHGMAMKSDDISACYCCSSCHDILDMRVQISPKDQLDWLDSREFYMRRAQTRTLRRMIEKGLVAING